MQHLDGNNGSEPSDIIGNIPNFPSYFISKDGRIFSKRMSWREMKPSVTKKGYLRVSLTDFSKKKYYPIHQLVAFAYLGPRPKGYFVCHNDGNPKNNNLSNLRYDTPKNNTKDQERHGTKLIGETTNNVVLTEAQIVEILTLTTKNLPTGEIAEIYGVHKSNILQIQKRITWSHVRISDELSHALEEAVSFKKKSEIRIFSESEIKEIFKLKASGVSNAFLSKKYGIDQHKISAILKREIYGDIEIPLNVLKLANSVKCIGSPKMFSDDSIKRLIQMKKDGSSYHEIAKEFNLSATQVKNFYFKYRKLFNNP